MNEQARRESMNREEGRHKDVPIQPSSTVSPHIVDLSAFSKQAQQGPRPDLDFGQKLSIWMRLFKRRDHSHRSMVPFMPHRKTPRASVAVFLKLPFAMIALLFKRKPKTPRPPVPKPTEALARPQAPVVPERPTPAPVTIKLSRKTKPAFSFFPDAAWKRQVAAFAVLAILVTLPLQALLSYAGLLERAGVIAADAQEAVGGLKDAGESALGGESSADAFARSAGAFASTRERVDDLTVRMAALLSGNGEKLSSGTKLLDAGEAVSKAGAELARGLDAMQLSQETNAVKLAHMTKALENALPHLEEGVARLNDVSARSVPSAYRPMFVRLREDVVSALADLKRASSSSPTLLDAIGANGKRRYLVVFQNANELRPTGGFIGSFALMDLKDGEIEKIEIPAGGSYDLRGGFNRRIKAPEQLRLVNPRWEFQDANWFPDFPTSARSLMWFYEKSGGPTVDGVIAVTSNVMQELLRAVGPIEMPEYGKTITADNFMLETQKAVEIEYDRETNRPKQIISDMAPKLLKKLVDGGSSDLPKLASAFGKALSSKDVQVYFSDESTQRAADDFGWTGALRPTADADYLAVIDTNIAGGKTDGVIDEFIRHETRFEEDGSIIDTVTVTRAHRGKPGELFTGIKNIDYMRVYVPKGSTLLSAEGFQAPAEGYFLPQDTTLQPSTLLAAVEGPTTIDEASGTTIHDESELTVFGNWVQLEPGETKTVKLSYRLPFRLADLTRAPASWVERAKDAVGAYVPTAELKLIVQKQAGTSRRTLESRTLAPKGWSIRTSVPEEANVEPGRLELKAPLDQDVFVGMVLVNRE
ncbi:MAG: DUF4012 domain-containing protein [Patescibacteria group bacterium]|nr:MAG: DUF4012 domain-containing protein [Patescibacteria group bacterium]